MGLQQYHKKRDFSETPEPKGKEEKTVKKLVFVVQRHEASRLHYDFRLELDGVLKSWAVPKGPSLNPEDKRLAMMTEDHPYDYKDFEGTIPEGNYGAGNVEIWDSGFYSVPESSSKKEAEKALREGLKAGNLKFVLHGQKLRGAFSLVKFKGKEKNAWLLIKHDDRYAVQEPYNSEDHLTIASGDDKKTSEHKKSKRKKLTDQDKSKATDLLIPETEQARDFIKPMHAEEADKPFDDKHWIFEVKWDGYRAIAEVDGNDVRLYSRNGTLFNELYKTVTDTLADWNLRAVLDGEIVVLNEDGVPVFQLLQNYKNDKRYPLVYYVFDVLEVDGQGLYDLPLTERKERLHKLLKESDIIKYSDHVVEKGKDFFQVMLEHGMEGMIAKKASSKYRPGMRTTDWLKIKHHKTQEAIIAGFTEPKGSRKHFGALVLGIREGDMLKYIGHSGSGFNAESLREIHRCLEPLIQEHSPFKERIKTNTPVTWVKPVLVCEVKYSEITNDGRLRHPIFLRLRSDKFPEEVTVENAEQVTIKNSNEKSVRNPMSKKTTDKSNEKDSETLSFGKTKVQITHPEKLYWPEEGLTKKDVVDYYQTIAKYILPYLKGRPQSLKRNPNGIRDSGFFQKDAGDEAPDWVKSIPIRSESTDKDVSYIVCNNAATLAYLNNLGCIEINPWHSITEALDKPDYLIVDIDPSEKNTFDQVIETALAVKQVADRAGAKSFCKTSGATGMHVYIPMGRKYTYDQIKDFAELICVLTNELLPDLTSMERNLQKRGKKHIYLDHLQNREGQTMVAAYSMRPRPGAPVSTPLKWGEVKPGLSPLHFTMRTVPDRLKETGDIFSGILGKGVDLNRCLKNLEKDT